MNTRAVFFAIFAVVALGLGLDYVDQQRSKRVEAEKKSIDKFIGHSVPMPPKF